VQPALAQFTQNGPKLVGTGAVGNANQGWSVALSGGGNSAVVGGRMDNANAGAVWVFTRSGGMWSQQGGKLVGTSAVGTAAQGVSVALSADGSTAIVGGPTDNSGAGAAWVFTRSGGVWSQQGNKLVGTGAVGAAQQGYSVALSCNTAIVGGFADNGSAGAWVFVAPPTATHDFSGDCLSDIVWRNTSGQLAMWFMNGTTLIGGGSPGTVTTDWIVAGTGDFNGDGFGDIVWRNTTTGQVSVWLMNGATVLASSGSPGTVTTDWVIAGTGDFNGDGNTDILWRNTTTGQAAIWLMNGASISSGAGIGTVTTDWVIAGTGDFNSDGMSDILWWNQNSGQVAMWFMDGMTLSGGGSPGSVPTSWTIQETGDFNADGMSDILWRDTSGNTAIWLMNGATILPASASLGNVATSWTIQGANAD
jgi:hypothetical protein